MAMLLDGGFILFLLFLGNLVWIQLEMLLYSFTCTALPTTTKTPKPNHHQDSSTRSPPPQNLLPSTAMARTVRPLTPRFWSRNQILRRAAPAFRALERSRLLLSYSEGRKGTEQWVRRGAAPSARSPQASASACPRARLPSRTRRRRRGWLRRRLLWSRRRRSPPPCLCGGWKALEAGARRWGNSFSVFLSSSCLIHHSCRASNGVWRCGEMTVLAMDWVRFFSRKIRRFHFQAKRCRFCIHVGQRLPLTTINFGVCTILVAICEPGLLSWVVAVVSKVDQMAYAPFFIWNRYF